MREWISDAFYNDAQNLPIYGLVLVLAFVILGISVFFHELGHLLFFKFNLKKKAKVYFIYKNLFNWHWEAGAKKDYEDLTDSQYSKLLVCGVLMGVLPIIISAYVWAPFALLIVPYIAGSWSDIKHIGRYLQAEED